ncbi:MULTISPECIES: PHP domain-containing protein [unclassified Clostridium]|uniref:helix-hairpin-helix domain-containing protein n=1 Tax=unclassified Clostridium TaxID=2614128 RepID=UPI002079D87D|nr:MULTISPECIES: PHP domain-containing protein [unclassified Clostridium]
MRKELITSIISKLKFNFPYSVEEYNKNLYIENYHSHKMESNVLQADCAESIENYAKKSVEYGSKCLFSGEHGWQGNVFLTYETANLIDKKTGDKVYNLKYRHSAEAYWVKNRHEKDRTNCHIVLVAKNNEGKGDINFALSLANGDESNSDGSFYYKPRLDLELLLNIPPENVIITSACIAGWKYEDANDIWLKLHNHFKNNFFLEVQAHNTEKQKELNKRILKLAKENDIQIICGLDSHYVYDDRNIKRDQILKYKNIHYEDEEGWYLDFPNGEEALRRFKTQGVLTEEEALTSIMNTNIFVDECEEIIFNRDFKIPCVYPNTTLQERNETYLKILKERYENEKLKTKEKYEGMLYEANEVIQSNVVDYFLTNDKIIHLATSKKYNGILTTTSRGSSASFITNKLLGFTTIDRFNAEIPIYPERFLTKERVLSGQMPDIDFNIDRQEPFVNATRELLGEHGCYPLLAIEKLKEKASWQLYAGANDIPFETANAISKAIDKYNEKLKYADEEDKKFIFIEDYIPKEYLDIYNKSLEYQGITINAKAHACGHLIFDGDIRREIGLIRVVSESTGKSTLCVAMEGGYLDSFGYVKNDYLIVDSVSLTHECFQSIGMDVPTFDELREMIRDDKPTWGIYAKGITCCINQCESKGTTQKAMQYKMTNLAESSAFIAGIRPGFRSLVNNFLQRIPYSTGVRQLDDLLSDSYGYLLYQESIMKLLSYLGLPMSKCYETIKKISKKKFKEKELAELKNKLLDGWKTKIGDTSKFEEIWETVENFAKYGFNSPHSLSMGGDSAYEAWFKAHHTSKFYEVAINHYMKKNKKDKIQSLTEEAMKFFEYKIGEYKFRNDNRKVTVNDENKTIYPSLSNLKGFGSHVSEALYDMRENKYENFIELIKDIKKTKITTPILVSLIKLDYFSEFGTPNQLLEIAKIYDTWGSCKTINKDKIIKNGFSIDEFKPFGNETEKQINKVDNKSLVEYLLSKINVKTTIYNRLVYQHEVCGYCFSRYSKFKNKGLVLDVDLKYSPVITMYLLETGEEIKYKAYKRDYNKNIIDKYDLIELGAIVKKQKTKKVGDGWINIEGFNYWLKGWKKLNN